MPMHLTPNFVLHLIKDEIETEKHRTEIAESRAVKQS